MRNILSASLLISGTTILQDPVVTLEEGWITGIATRDARPLPASSTGVKIYDFPGAILAPSYLDIHIHGGSGHDVMEGTPEALHAIAASVGAHGVGAFFPTTVTAPVERTLRALEGLANEIEVNEIAQKDTRPVAVPLGIHLEGPFLSHGKRGVHPENLLAKPSIALFERFWQASRGHIRLMTIAPELELAAELIEHASALGVRCSLGHSDATAAEAAEGHRAGARSATHTFNAMRRIGHRDPGIAGYVLSTDDLYADIICDGIHVDPILLNIFFRAKGPTRAILITDGIAATGMPEGRYALGTLEVEVKDGRCILAGTGSGDGKEILAGSVLTLDQAVRNFSRFTGSGIEVGAALLAARNPALMMGVDDRWGVLEEGRRGYLIVLSPKGDVIGTVSAGRVALCSGTTVGS